MTSSIGDTETLTSAELEARKRRERILQLKRKAQFKTSGKEEIVDEESKIDQVNSSLKENTSANVNSSNEKDSSDLPVKTKYDKKTESDELDLTKLSSRKVDWDLKRGIEKNLAILQEQTDELIAEIVQESMDSDEDDAD